MKQRLYKLLWLIIVLAIGFIWAFGMEAWNKAAKAEVMDRRELHYDADGDFILIDAIEAHIGVYKATKPIKHIWLGGGTAAVDTGVYELNICEGWIELSYRELDREGVWVIYLKDKDTDFLRENVEQGCPVLVY